MMFTLDKKIKKSKFSFDYFLGDPSTYVVISKHILSFKFFKQMKNFIVMTFLLLSSGTAFCQLMNTDKITEVYGQEWLTDTEVNNPALLTLMDKYITYGFNVKNVSEGKYAEFVPLEFVPLSGKEGGTVTVSEFLADFESENFNPLRYQFFPAKDFQVFKLQGVNKIIYLLPQESILLK